MVPQMKTTLTAMFPVLLGYALAQVGNSLQGTLLSVRAGIAGFAPVEIALIGTGFWIGLVCGSLRAGLLIHRVGHTRAYAAFAAISGAAPLLHLLQVNQTLWILERALTGFCFAGMFMVVESWLNSAVGAAIRGRMQGLYSMVGLLAGMSGQLLLPIYDPTSFQRFTIVSIAISLALVPVSLATASAPSAPAGKARIDLLGLYRVSPFGIIAALLCGVCTGSFFSLGPVLAQRVGLDGLGVALFMAIGTLGGFALSGLLGWVSDKGDRRVLITGLSTSAAAILFAFAVFLPERLPTPANFLVVAAFGAFVIPTYSIVCAYVNDLVRNGDFVSASGGLLIAQGLGAATGPLLAGAAMSYFGPSGALYPIIVAQVLMASWGLLWMSRRAAARKPTIPLAHAPSPSQSWC